jgi:hypothetical protein
MWLIGTGLCREGEPGFFWVASAPSKQTLPFLALNTVTVFAIFRAGSFTMT